MKTQLKIIVFISLLIFGSSLSAQVSQFRGPERNGHFPGTGLLQEWPENGPKLINTIENLDPGYSSPVVYNKIIYISGKRDNNNVLTAFKLDGSLIWETTYGKAWEKSYPESRNTPTIENNRIYITSGMGNVNCIDAENGKVLWEVNTHEKFGGEFHRWGYAESLVITEDAVISSPTGDKTVMVALDKMNGEILWQTESLGDVRSYVSPILVNHNSRNIILAVTSQHALGVDAENGTILWKFDIVTNFTTGRRNNTNTPLYHKGEIFITSGYDATSLMLKLSEDGESVTLKWKNDVLDTHHGGVVNVDGYIYGSNWINNGNGNWVCLNWDNGELMYEEKWHNKGSVIYADNRLYLYEEKQGHVGLVDPDPSGFKLKGSFRITDGFGPHWAHPAIYNSKLFIRHGDVLKIYGISSE